MLLRVCRAGILPPVRAGADIDAPSGTEGMNPLMASAMSGRTSTVRALAELGANIDYENDERETALMYASGVGHAEVVKLLAEPLLPKLRGYFAEFLRESYLAPLGILYLPTCVGLRYRHLLFKIFRAFLGSMT